MTDLGVDYSFSRPNLDAMWNAGYRFMSRYLSWLPNSKCISKAEYDALIHRGFEVALNWEYQAKDCLGGAASGKLHANEAVKQARAIGYQPGSTIYFSADFDATEAQQTPINAYMTAAKAIVHAAGFRIGIYGGYWVVKRALDAGVVDDAWQAYAWSGGHWDPRAHLRQVLNGIKVGGSAVDKDSRVGATYFGGRHASGAPTPPTATPKPAPAPAPVTTKSVPLTYKVVSGDSLSKIAAHFGLKDWQTLYNANRARIGADPNRIIPGWILTIPGHYTTVTVPAPAPVKPAAVFTASAPVPSPAKAAAVVAAEAAVASRVVEAAGAPDPVVPPLPVMHPLSVAPAAVETPAVSPAPAPAPVVEAPAPEASPAPVVAAVSDTESWLAYLKGEVAHVEDALHHLPTTVIPAVPALTEPAPEGAPHVMFTRAYWEYVAERALKTFAQTVVGALGVGQSHVVSINWGNAAALGGAAAIASVLTSISVLSGAKSVPAADAEDTPAE